MHRRLCACCRAHAPCFTVYFAFARLAAAIMAARWLQISLGKNCSTLGKNCWHRHAVALGNFCRPRY
ncbi:protein of unknown function [Bradyrhizobium vignae]|uniref:Uncharacterized protein n=1 Tax=Bradyrhizobium vignae TaxID=1549949 RepID=A0A2U3Q7R3_9BRAD|nr:protein of unknown function [Bradyrhizobium vignae]